MDKNGKKASKVTVFELKVERYPTNDSLKIRKA